MASSQQKEHHFFLFRHCVRSTSFSIDLHLKNASAATNFPLDPQSYVHEPLPNWQVPENWCTPKALEDVQFMGQRLVDSGVITAGGDASKEGSSSNKKLQFEFISDTSHRDADTAYALALGLNDALLEQSPDTLSSLSMPAGMLDVFYAPWLFDPIEEALCEQQYTLDELVASAKNRLDHIPSPDLVQSLATLEKVAGIGSFGNLREKIPLDPTLTSAQNDKVYISGAA
eukprot:scaffold337_cov172-Amphora_coffeaeformis.AAC.18